MNNPIVLTFDCGTQSIRALLVDKFGNILAKEQKKFTPYYSLKPGYAEQKASVYEDALKDVSIAIHKNNPSLIDDIIAVTITTIRDTCVCVNDKGEVIRDIIVWLDSREAECKNPLPLASTALFSAVGMMNALNDQRKITKANWIQENEPEIWKNTFKYMMFSAYMVYKLTGNMVDSSASAIGHIPFDYEHNVWYESSNIKAPIFNVSKDKLVDLKKPGEILGYITKDVSANLLIKEGLPLIATGSDKGCETLGCGVIDNDMASLSFGTTATVQISTRKYVEPQMFMPAYPGVVAGTWNPEIQIYRGYWMVNWFKNEFAHKEVKEAEALNVAPEALLNERLKEIPAGCDGLMLQPYWAPLLKSPEAKGSIIGFSGEHTRIHIYKAIIEGIGYGLLDGMKSMEKKIHRKISAVTVSGGGSQSKEICQITADMFGVPVRKIQTYEACGLGSSIVAFVSMGIYQDYKEAIKNMVHYKEEFIPNMEVNKVYERLYNDIYKNIYKCLKPIYTKMRTIVNEKKGEN